jgi:hypothetical protein
LQVIIYLGEMKMNCERFVRLVCVLLALVVAMMSAPVLAQEAGDADSDLAKKTQNPLADLISLPFQNNTNFNVGPKDKTQNTLNIQPVAPFNLNEDWNLITRTIAPLICMPEFTNEGSEFGLGDIQFTAFLSPLDSGRLTWGAGPVFRFPTATDERLGSDKWSAGPSAVFLGIEGPWVIGVLAQNVWSYAGSSSRESVNEFLLQYFINYNMPGGWYISSAPIITANWEADSGNRWTVPFGGGIGKIVRIGKMPVNVQCQAFYNVEKPSNGADWTLRLQMQLLFPK